VEKKGDFFSQGSTAQNKEQQGIPKENGEERGNRSREVFFFFPFFFSTLFLPISPLSRFFSLSRKRASSLCSQKRRSPFYPISKIPGCLMFLLLY
jgi:hypothetical protein